MLGRTVAEKLKRREITQTVRSRRMTAPFFMCRGFYVPVYLDDVELYSVRITEITETKLSDLTTFDAEIGGFNDLGELKKALKIAGFRFKPLYEYKGFKIQFTAKAN